MGHEIRTWSTDSIEVAKRFDYWVGAICECFLEMEADTAAPLSFAACLKSTPLAELNVNHVTGSAQRVYRTPQTISRSSRGYYYLLCKERAPCSITQYGAGSSRLLPGDLALIDSRRPYKLDFPEAVDVFSLQLPVGWLETWVPEAQAQLGMRIDGSAGWGSVLGPYIRQLHAFPGPLSADLHREQLGGLIALAFDVTSTVPALAAPGLLEHIDAVLRSRFAEPGLCAVQIADQVGVSTRTLHRALARSGRTFSGALMQVRMEAAKRMLTASPCRRITVGEIGRRIGFMDASHFARAWRAWSGESPSRTRQSW
ncbi:helix-turn-helix domain-containing protein [Burkholderia anthina]|uniref:helix-turn-helix domain-containing protein n=1 Tax=Burkholderia anthina TaxID=179879 RepID=UPI001589B553|nr:helix-turn-helix domain-containing protein [Burkholderia anthina]